MKPEKAEPNPDAEINLVSPVPEPRYTISVTLDPKDHAHVLQEAAADDRTPSKWLKRYLHDSFSL